ncbi:hypothetical protein NDU88_003252 [Pleurodeles waltl]|uniref:Uncharacterized protein n=1 Tax=Pleurodeles waltl TaxID=8319 RepID=A0AAV7Q953_PLEWA|nr:hypothetical protein NDU88_003252 [Pleurodeles waltl]
MGNRTLRDLCWDLRHFLVSIHLENLAVKRSLLQALRHSPPAGQLLNHHPKAPPSRTTTHFCGSSDGPSDLLDYLDVRFKRGTELPTWVAILQNDGFPHF